MVPYHFPSANGTSTVAYYILPSSSNCIRGIVQISHGMCEFFERYEDFCHFLSCNGFVVCGNDHIGHGNSVKNNLELGFFAKKNGWKYMVEDAHTLTKLVQIDYPGVPYILFGHSMGSFIARLCLSAYGADYSGAIICGSGDGNPLAPLGIKIADWYIRHKGPLYRSETLKKLSTGAFNKRFAVEKDDNSWLSRDIVARSQYKDHPKFNFTFTACGYRDLFQLNLKSNEEDWYQSLPKHLPLLLVSGENDPVGDFGKGIRRVYLRLLKAGLDDVTLKLYPGARHEILNEINRKEVYGDILSFCERVSCQ